MAAVPEGP
jgi:hypothetical protein